MAPRLTGPVLTHNHELGYLLTPVKGDVLVGDRMVPPVIEAHFPGVDGQTSLFMCIEVLDGVPRCTELTFKSVEGGQDVRQKDLKALLTLGLDDLIENMVALCSPVIVERLPTGVVRARQSSGDAFVTGGMKAVRNARKGSRRRMTEDRKQRVADIYNAQEMGGLEAVEAAFGVSRSTAARYIRAARDAGLIQRETEA